MKRDESKRRRRGKKSILETRVSLLESNSPLYFSGAIRVAALRLSTVLARSPNKWGS